MSTVAGIFGFSNPQPSSPHPKIAYNAFVGIELEIEDVNYLSVPMWDCTEDGSLRNGCELVCSSPYSGEDLYRAIELLSDAVCRSEAKGTWRCSTHVHLDVRDCDSDTVKRIILGWAFYEKMLFKCSGFHRYRSNFCPAFAVVQAQVINASSAFNHDGERFFASLIHNWDKYTSLNLLPLSQFGSVEFRVSEPKWKRTNLINLVNRYLTLKKLAVENSNLTLEEYVEFLRNEGFRPMVEYLPLDYSIDQSDLDFGYQLANDVLNLRSEGINVVPRIRIGGMSEEAINELVIPSDIFSSWTTFRDHALAKDIRYRLIFNHIFGENLSSSPNEAVITVGKMRQLIDSWGAIANERGRTDREIRDTIIRTWSRDLERFIDSF